MKTRAALALAVVAGLPAAVSAQETFVVSYSWFEVNAGTLNPSTVPGVAGNSVVDTGEGARIRMGITARINGTNAVGQTSLYTIPAPGGTGTVKGLGSAVYDLVGDLNAASANGTWTQLAGPVAPLTFGGSAGTAQPGGASVHGMGGAQVVSPQPAGAPSTGTTANGTNNDNRQSQGSWTPASYAARTVNFLGRASVLVPGTSAAFPFGQGNSLLVSYGFATQEDDQFNIYTYDLLVGKYIGSSFGTGINIPIAPAPSSLALLGLGALVAGGRRRS